MPGGPMWVPAGPPPRPPRRYRAWPWLLAVTLVLGGLCYGGYLVVKSQTEPLAREHTITIANLAPDGLHQMIVTDRIAFAIGQRTDGSVEVSAVQLATKEKSSYTSQPAGGWSVAQQLEDWVAVLSVPAADGSRTMFVANPTEGAQAQVTVANGETVTLMGAFGGGSQLEYIAYSAGAGTVRFGTVDGRTSAPGKAVPLPAGARPLKLQRGEREAYFVDGGGSIWRFAAGALDRTQAKAPPGHPATLTHYDDDLGRKLVIAEDKPGYQVLSLGSPVYKAAADRRPVWMGRCGGSDDVCVLDESPGGPPTRELYLLQAAGSGPRVPVPYAAVPGQVVKAAEFVILPMQENDTAGAVLADTSRGSYRKYYSDVRPLGAGRSGAVDAVLLPIRPAGEAATWAGTPQTLDLQGIDLTNDRKTKLGTVTAIPASCHVGGGRLACATRDDFQVWKVDRG